MDNKQLKMTLDLTKCIVGKKYSLSVYKNGNKVGNKQYKFSHYVDLKTFFEDEPYEDVECVLTLTYSGPNSRFKNIDDSIAILLLKNGKLAACGFDKFLSDLIQDANETTITITEAE